MQEKSITKLLSWFLNLKIMYLIVNVSSSLLGEIKIRVVEVGVEERLNNNNIAKNM